MHQSVLIIIILREKETGTCCIVWCRNQYNRYLFDFSERIYVCLLEVHCHSSGFFFVEFGDFGVHDAVDSLAEV